MKGKKNGCSYIFSLEEFDLTVLLNCSVFLEAGSMQVSELFDSAAWDGFLSKAT